jgi:hypothetical protein
MSNRQKHRGAHSSDTLLFSEQYMDDLRKAVADYSLLLSRGYSEKASLKLVGDHFSLKERQRQSIMRCACSDQRLELRRQKCLLPIAIKHQAVFVDGFNFLITIESALSGGLIFEGRDGCFRDIASVHGSYKKVEETEHAIQLIGKCLHELQPVTVTWLFDKPVSNSRRLSRLMLDLAGQNNWPWEATLAYNPDKILAEAPGIVVSSDGVVIDTALHWTCLSRHIIRNCIPGAKVLSLSTTDIMQAPR